MLCLYPGAKRRLLHGYELLPSETRIYTKIQLERAVWYTVFLVDF